MALTLSIVKHILVTLCFLECLLLSGFLFGWSSLVYVFKELDYFQKYCSTSSNFSVAKNASGSSFIKAGNNVTIHDNVGCHEQDAALDLIFTVATVGSMLLNLPLGAIIDRYGITVGRITSG